MKDKHTTCPRKGGVSAEDIFVANMLSERIIYIKPLLGPCP